MINIRSFLILIAAGLIIIYTICEIPPNEDPFADKSSPKITDIQYTSPPAVADMKRRHTESHGPFSVGVFGNSRVLMLGSEALALPNTRYFNYALSSESLSGSLILIKDMAQQSRLPKTILIGIDHFYLQRDNMPIWPPFAQRIDHAIYGIRRALAATDYSVRTAARRLWRALWGETVRFKMVFNPQLLVHGIDRILQIDKPMPEAAPDQGGYRADGSRRQDTTISQNFGIIPQTNSEMDIAQLRDHLSALGDLAQQGYRIYLFETPLHPETAQKIETLENTYVRMARAIWHQDCARWNLTCIDAPLLDDTTAVLWRDASHPPEQPWAAFVKTTLTRFGGYAVQ